MGVVNNCFMLCFGNGFISEMVNGVMVINKFNGWCYYFFFFLNVNIVVDGLLVVG